MSGRGALRSPRLGLVPSVGQKVWALWGPSRLWGPPSYLGARLPSPMWSSQERSTEEGSYGS